MKTSPGTVPFSFWTQSCCNQLQSQPDDWDGYRRLRTGNSAAGFLRGLSASWDQSCHELWLMDAQGSVLAGSNIPSTTSHVATRPRHGWTVRPHHGCFELHAQILTQLVRQEKSFANVKPLVC